MQARVYQREGELTLVIPPDVAATAEIAADSEVDVTVENGAILVRATTRPAYSLQQLLAQVTDENRHAETDWGPAVGKERLSCARSAPR